MPEPSTCSVAIAGGGLAGLCLAVQLKRAEPALRVVVAERHPGPMPDAAFKVGESSVEIGSHYFERILGLEHVLCAQLRKFGLRFFFPRASNRDIAERLECGPGRFLSVPSYQIDRGRFENALAARCRDLGVELLLGCPIRDIRVGGNGNPHELTIGGCGTATRSIRSRWLVDASGRARLLNRKLGLARRNGHTVNAAWLRFDAEIDLDTWSSGKAFRSRVQERRLLSTNHLMGTGYWVWVIPLVAGRTSVGVVADDALHPFEEIHRLDKMMHWLERYEPQLASRLAPRLQDRMDFRALKDFSYGCRQVFSSDRWCITGEAGVFVDPLYSPGSDFIGMGNGFIADLVIRDLRGESIEAIAMRHDRTYLSLYRSMLGVFERQYPIMGNARIMTVKIIWDLLMYWGGIALIHNHGKLCDPRFMARAREFLTPLGALGIRMQRFLRRWHESDPSRDDPPAGYVDYAAIGFLARLNAALREEADDESLLEQLQRNLALAQELDREIRAQAARVRPELGTDRGAERAVPRRLAAVFEVLWPLQAG